MKAGFTSRLSALRSHRHRRAARLLIALVGALYLVVTTAGWGSGPSQLTRPSKVTLDKATRAKLQHVLDEQFAKSGLPGVAAAVWIGNQRWQSVLGVSDLGTQAPFKLDDNVRIASVTKSYTATAVLELVKNRTLNLDDKLESYVPGIPNGSQITIRQVLGMQSGVFDFTTDESFIAAFDADPTMPFEPSQAVDIIKQHQPAFAPGTKTEYADSNYILLGLIIEKVTGRPAGQVIEEQVVKKARRPRPHDLPDRRNRPGSPPNGVRAEPR